MISNCISTLHTTSYFLCLYEKLVTVTSNNHLYLDRVCKPAYLVPVPSHDKLGGLCKEGHPA